MLQTRVLHCIDYRDPCRKTSGAAYRITKGFAYHHGTLLVDSDLDKLQRSISSPELQKINTKATNSVRSKVINLREKDRHITVDDVSRALEENFREQNNIEASTVVVGPESMTPEDYAEEAFLCEVRGHFLSCLPNEEKLSVVAPCGCDYPSTL